MLIRSGYSYGRARRHDRASSSLAGSSTIQLVDGSAVAASAAPLPATTQMQGTDPLTEVLRTVKLTGALFFVTDASSPWGVEVPPADAFASIILPRAQHVVSYHVILEGAGWASVPGVASTRFEAGDILVFAHHDRYVMLGAPEQPPELDANATLTFFVEMAAGRLPFVVHEGGGGEPRTRFVCGFLGCDMRPFNPVLSTLPHLLRVQPSDASQESLLRRLINITLAEARQPRVAGEAVRLRLSELIFVEVLRQYLQSHAGNETGWLSGLRDASIGKALAALHEHPAHPWTLNELAGHVGLSRAAMAARFTHLVGHAPMEYLALWRMQIASRLLADSCMKVATIAGEVGYESEAAFSRAFKKIVGRSPAAWREGE